MTLRTIQHQAAATGVPKPLSPDLIRGQAASKDQVSHVDHLPYGTWDRRAIARFTYPDDSNVPDGATVYNSSPVWLSRDTVPGNTAGAAEYQYLKVKGTFEETVALAHARASARDPQYGDLAGAQAVLQARDGAFYIAELHGWGDEVPVAPGEPGGPAGPYMLEDVVTAGGTVQRYTPSLRAVVGASTWVDFRPNSAADRRVP